jgi:MFS family permease
MGRASRPAGGYPTYLLAPAVAFCWLNVGGFRSGLAIGAVGFAVLSQAHSLPVFYLAYAITGLGFPMATMPSGKIIGSWFDSRRGRMMGVVGAGNNFGGLIAVNISSALARSPGWGWQVRDPPGSKCHPSLACAISHCATYGYIWLHMAGISPAGDPAPRVCGWAYGVQYAAGAFSVISALLMVMYCSLVSDTPPQEVRTHTRDVITRYSTTLPAAQGSLPCLWI